MNEYQKMLHEIEAKKLELEQKIANVVQAEISQWQKETSFPVQNVYVDLVQVQTIGESKTYEVASTSVDIDFKP
jgi:hypothetical protein